MHLPGSDDGNCQASAAGKAAGTAIGAGEHLLHSFYARVFFNMQQAVRDDQQGREYEAESCQCKYCYGHVRVRRVGTKLFY